MSPNTSPARIAANRANALKSTGPKTTGGKARSALNGLVHGLRSETIVLPGEDPAQFDALCDALADEFQPQTVTEQHFIDIMADCRWLVDRARRQETAALTQKMAEARARYDAQHSADSATPLPQPKPVPDPIDLEAVPWEDRCAVAAQLVRQTPEGRNYFLDRWHFLRAQFLNAERSTDFLDEMLLMLGHRAGELVKGDPVTEQVTLDWVSLWFLHRTPNRHRVSDAIFRSSKLRGSDLEKEANRLLPKVLPYEEGMARLLATIDEQIAQLEAANALSDPESEPPDSAAEPVTGNPIDSAAREAACAIALFDDSKEGMLRLRYITAHENAYSRAFRNLLALRRQRGAEGKAAAANPPLPTEANPTAPVEAPAPTEASAEPLPQPVERSERPEGVTSPTPVSPFNPPDEHNRK